MGALFSSAAVAVTGRATKNHNQQTLLAASDAGAGADDGDHWSGLPEDLLLVVMQSLDAPSIVRSGAACTSWRSAYAAFRTLRLPSPTQGPCVLYAADNSNGGAMHMYCPSTNTKFRVPFFHGGGPGFVFSASGCRVFTTDEAGDPYLLNPLTGARAAPPPVRTLPGLDAFFDAQGNSTAPGGLPVRAKDWAFRRVAISDKDTPLVLVVHMLNETLAFARPGDARWTPLSGAGPLASQHRRCFSDVLYYQSRRLFYALRRDGSVYSVDLHGHGGGRGLPEVRKIMRDASVLSSDVKYLAVAPRDVNGGGGGGELLQVWRIWHHTHGPLEHRHTFQDSLRRKLVFQDRLDCSEDDADTGINNNNKQINELAAGDNDADTDDETPSTSISSCLGTAAGKKKKKLGIATSEVVVFRVDEGRQKLVKLRGIGEHALFVGNNSGVCVPTKDLPAFEPDCAYLTADSNAYGATLPIDMGVWSFQRRRMTGHGGAAWAWPEELRRRRPRTECWPGPVPAPVWITPSLW